MVVAISYPKLYTKIEVIIMSENKYGLKNRTRISNAIRTDLHEELKNISYDSKVPMSKLLDEAIELLIEKRKSAN